MGEVSQTADTIREAVFGANDGAVSTFGILSGLVGASIASPTIALVGVVQIFAAGLSMGLGAYISTKSENEVLMAEMKTQSKRINHHPAREKSAVRDVLAEHGVVGKELDAAVKDITRDSAKWSHFLVETRLGRAPENLAHPVAGGVVMFVSFVLAGLFPVLPFFFLGSTAALPFSALLALAVLFGVGAAKTRFTKKNAAMSGFENVLIGAITGVVGYAVGSIVSSFL
jgi:VIT1/CCC1 family predicted Fe2+/Mn2+ transporter